MFAAASTESAAVRARRTMGRLGGHSFVAAQLFLNTLHEHIVLIVRRPRGASAAQSWVGLQRRYVRQDRDGVELGVEALGSIQKYSVWRGSVPLGVTFEGSYTQKSLVSKQQSQHEESQRSLRWREAGTSGHV